MQISDDEGEKKDSKKNWDMPSHRRTAIGHKYEWTKGGRPDGEKRGGKGRVESEGARSMRIPSKGWKAVDRKPKEDVAKGEGIKGGLETLLQGGGGTQGEKSPRRMWFLGSQKNEDGGEHDGGKVPSIFKGMKKKLRGIYSQVV